MGEAVSRTKEDTVIFGSDNYQLYRQIGFIEEIQRIYNKQKGTGDYAKDNVKTIIFGYGKTGI